MTTLRQFAARPPAVPMSTTWYLADLGEAKGRQELFTRQSPQRLKALREHAMIESAVSSNRIEGVEIDASRIRAVVLGKPALRDRNEEEVRGYRDALKLIHESGQRLAVSEKTIRQLHRLSRGQIWDAGQYKQNKQRYYETLEQSSQGWHGGTHNPWSYANYVLYILKTAYKEFEDRVGQMKAPRGEKSEIVARAIRRATGDFSITDLQRECPGVSMDMIRHVLKGLTDLYENIRAHKKVLDRHHMSGGNG